MPLALIAKRTRMGKMLGLCACFWGIAATAFAAVRNFEGAFACRFLIGLGGQSAILIPLLYDTDYAEAGYAPLVQVYLSRFYSRAALGTRIAFWLAMAPMGYVLSPLQLVGVE